jgi:hypothetical protein
MRMLAWAALASIDSDVRGDGSDVIDIDDFLLSTTPIVSS